MPLSPKQFNDRKEKAKRADIKAVIESTGARPASSDAVKGVYMYNAPYREDSKPSLKIDVQKQLFIDFGQTGAEGDVIELTRLIFGRGDKNNFSFFKAMEWLEHFSGGSVAPQAIQAPQPQKKRVSDDPMGEGRYKLIKALPVTKKSHPTNLAYIQDIRKIGLPLATRFLEIIQYQDLEAPASDQYNGVRYAVGGPNDSGGREIRMPSVHSNFKTVIGPKDVSSFDGHPAATTGHIFEGRFDFLTRLQMAGETFNYYPTIVTNSGRLARRAAQVAKERWPHIKNWHVWQDNDEEGERSTIAFAEELGPDYTVGAVNSWYEGYKDLNKCWTDAPPEILRTLTAQILATVKKPDETLEVKTKNQHVRNNPTNNPNFL